MPFIISGLVLFYLGWAGLIFCQWRGIRAEARTNFEREKSEGAISKHLTEDKFVDVYTRVYGPRGSAYMFLSSGLALILLPFIVMITGTLWYKIWLLSGANEVFAEGTLIHSFYLAVTTMAAFVGIAALFMRRYHFHAPKKFPAELKNVLEGQT